MSAALKTPSRRLPRQSAKARPVKKCQPPDLEINGLHWIFFEEDGELQFRAVEFFSPDEWYLGNTDGPWMSVDEATEIGWKYFGPAKSPLELA